MGEVMQTKVMTIIAFALLIGFGLGWLAGTTASHRFYRPQLEALKAMLKKDTPYPR